MMEKTRDEGGIWIHLDLVIEILSRIPVKNLLKFKCLSKDLSRMIQSRNFVDSCLSLNRPRLLFYFECEDKKALVFFSAPHRSICSVAPTRHEMTVTGVSLRSPPVRGLIFYTVGPNQHVICNPATRQHLSLPANQVLGKSDDLEEFLIFGYDPILNQFKVLCISGSRNQYQFWVLTVGQDGNLWRKIHEGIPNHLHPSKCNHVRGQSGICINGILYFKVYCHTPGYGHRGMTTHVMSFDINSEKFSLIETNPHLPWFSKLVDFQGKLAFISRANDCSVEFCLLEHKEWSSRIFYLAWAQGTVYSSHYSSISRSVLGICDGEIVFAPPDFKVGFTWHLSLEKKTTRKVDFEIPASYGPYASYLVSFFANHADATISL